MKYLVHLKMLLVVKETIPLTTTRSKSDNNFPLKKNFTLKVRIIEG